MAPRRAGAKTPGLRISPELILPIDAVTETFAILAKRRAGKSNAAVVMAEEMFDAGLPWVAVDPKGDWWGVRAAGDGKKAGLAVVVFGGLHGDVPLEPGAGRVVARLFAERRLTGVLDVSEMTKADQRRFLADFAEELYRRNREPLHVFAEEADEYIPQRVTQGVTRLVGAWESLIKRGGFRGIGVTLISQRSASLNKDVLTQAETLIAMRTPSPQDRKAILDWVEHHEAGADAVAELPSLASGEAWVFSPQWLDVLQKIKFRRRRTFDSGATPKVGGTPRPPATLAEVDLAEIEQAMADTIERAEAGDPAALRRRIHQLESRLAKQQRSEPTREPVVETVVERVEVPVLPDVTLDRLDAIVQALDARYTAHQEQLTAALQVLSEARDQIRAIQDTIRGLHGRGTQRDPEDPPTARGANRSSGVLGVGTKPRRLRAPAGDGNTVQLRSGARRMVESLGRMAPLRLTKSQWGTVAHLKTNSGTWSTYLSDIRRAGLIDENAAGFTLSEAGFAYLGGRPDPMTATELQDHYRQILRAGAAKMLDALIEAYPEGLTREELGTATGLVTTSGTFSTYLSELTRNGLAERSAGLYKATSVLMHGAEIEE
jgi:hypothetical protein